MKVLVIPDVHLKPDIIFKAQIKMKQHGCDNAVFLGDFADDWGKGQHIGLYDDTFDALDDFLKNFPDSLICYGNHDISYVWEKYETGYSPLAKDTVVARLQELYKKHGKDRFRFIHKIDNVIFSHAGLTKGFVLHHFAYDTDTSLEHIIEMTNAMPEKDLWDDASPLWARPQHGYWYYSKNLLQVVGHTPVSKPVYHEEQKLLVCDTFSTYSDGKPIGNRKYIIVDTITKDWEEV